jgi:glycosyltransferase involved in cell wall biosynthesis
MRHPEISVIIPCYNGGKDIEQALRSVLAQGMACEIIVVDDASTDDSLQILQALAREIPLMIVRNEKNLGLAGARNAGLSAANGRWVNFLDHDDYLLPGKFKAQLNQIRAHPDTDISYTDSQISSSGKILDFTLKDIWSPPTTNTLDRLLEGNFIAIHAALISARVFKSVSFDADLRRAEDWDFWLKVAMAGFKFRFLDEPYVVYVKGGVTLSSNVLLALDYAWKVLSRLDESRLTTHQLALLKQYKKGILLHKFDLLVRSGSKDALTVLRSASTQSGLSGYRKMTLAIINRNFQLGRWFYVLASLLAEIRHLPRTRKLRAYYKSA